jgi:RND family efflux transporter MFP subunit
MGFVKRLSIFLINKLKTLITRFKALSRRKKILVIIAAIILVFFVIPSIVNSNKKPVYESARVQKADITEVVTETGTIAVSGRVDIQSPTNGVVTEVFVNNGDMVEKGQTLFTVESSATEQEQRSAYSDYLAAQTSLNNANATLNSLQAELFRTNQVFVNDRGVDNPSKDQKDDPVYIQQNANWLKAEADYKNQQNVIAQAQAHASSAYLAYQATQNATVKATLNGKISNLAVTPGSGVKTQTLTVSPKPVLTISSQGSTEVLVSLSESDIAKIQENQQATFEINSINDKKYKGVVRRVDEIGTNEEGVIRYSVYIEMLDADSRIRSGMTVDVDIITKKLDNVLSVPNSAVKPYKGGRAVRVYDSGKRDFVYKPVTVGVRGDSRTQILDGIEEGQEVVTSLSNEQLKRPGPFGN